MTTQTDTTEAIVTGLLPVTQEDRVEAWPIWKWIFRESAEEAYFMEGDEDEHFIVQAFARHRIQSSTTHTEATSVAPDGLRLFALGDRVCKVGGASWQGHVVGFYGTALTPIGYAVESEREPGSVQIYPERALSAAPPAPAEVDVNNIPDWPYADRLQFDQSEIKMLAGRQWVALELAESKLQFWQQRDWQYGWTVKPPAISPARAEATSVEVDVPSEMVAIGIDGSRTVIRRNADGSWPVGSPIAISPAPAEATSVEVERLRTALEPFSELSVWISENRSDWDTDQHEVQIENWPYTLSVGWLREARAARAALRTAAPDTDEGSRHG